ncbi:MAG: serine hydrolase, partial [Micrococcales bacterium]|nr:serine hydrolase [Micrococcales bacterium]
PATPSAAWRDEPPRLAGLADVVVAGAGRLLTLPQVLAMLEWTSLVVVREVGQGTGELVHEAYADGVGPGDRLLGASMTKSALAHLVGLAVNDARLDLAAPVSAYVPELADGGYGPVPVLDVLRMTSGVEWIEDHRDPDGPAARLTACAFTGRGSMREQLRALRTRCPPGQRWEYSTADSQVLDWVRERATGETFVSALSRLRTELGCTGGATVAADGQGVPLAGGGLGATARDWARFGMLQVDGCAPGGHQLLSPQWLDTAGRPTLPFVQPGRLPSAITTHAGFAGHWWPLDGTGRRVTADGSRGQFTYVDRDRRVVVTLTSCWAYADAMLDRQCRDLAYLTLPVIAQVASRG